MGQVMRTEGLFSLTQVVVNTIARHTQLISDFV